jgi:NADPH:quinone reductase
LRAVVIGVDGTLDLREVPDPVLGSHGLLIDVAAAGVNRADLAQREGRHDPTLAPASGGALIAGMDAAGVIVQIGESVTRFRVGERVMGLLAGGYAERAVLDSRLAISVPDGWSLVEGAAAVSGLQTEYDALVNAGQLNAGEVVVIHGASTPVGLTGIQIARHLAAGLVIATIRTARADAEVRRAGADLVIHTSVQALPDAVQASSQHRGADVIIDHVGGDSLSDSVRSLAIGGRLVSVGRLAGATGQLDLEALAYKRARIVGVTFRTRSIAEHSQIARGVTERLLPAMTRGELRPIIDHTYPLHRAAEAHARMATNRHRGKLVLTVP